MTKIITILGALTVASTNTIAFRDIAPYQTKNLQSVLAKSNDDVPNYIFVAYNERWEFKFWVHLNNSDYNGFSGFLDQISFNLSDFNWHAWPIYLFQWLDDDDFYHPMPGLNDHTKHGFFHWPFPYDIRLETFMAHFGAKSDDKSHTAFHMASSWGTWGSFGQNVDNQWNAAVAAHKALGITFHFDFEWYADYQGYVTIPPTFTIITS